MRTTRQQIVQINSAALKAVAVLAKKLTLEVTANLIEDTPVDTGWASSNWVPEIGAPFTTPTGSPESVNNAAQSQGIAKVATSYRSIKQGKIYVSNYVPYIGRLNDGSSLKAPSGYVQIAIDKAVVKVFTNNSVINI